MTRLAYICSLPHSGSTMLSLFAGTHSQLIGLGGIDRAVSLLAAGDEKSTALQCTCGATAEECLYWGEVSRRLPKSGKPNRQQRYTIALEAFRKVFGEHAWPVDSSKHIDPLGDLSAMKLEVRALHLIKDVRSLTASFVDQARKSKGKTRPPTLLAIEYFWRWRRENGKIENSLREHRIPSHRIGYEELCLAPEKIMATISGFLEVPAESGSLALAESRSHLIVGNRMRNSADKQQVRYDHRWFSRSDWLLAALIFPQILRYNSTAVYSNGCDSVWRQ